MSGPSGCGKSTLLSILGLLDTPTGGKYLLNGNPVENLSFSERSRIRNQEIGFIFQSFNLIGDLTVEENVELPLTYRAGMPSAERKKRVKEALERVNMAHRMKHYPAQLSGGQQQRVAVARALAGSPSILLADEPTGNLDSKNGEAVMHLLSDLHREGATICMVTHDPRFAKHAQREVHLFDGKVVSETELKKLVAAVAKEPGLRRSDGGHAGFGHCREQHDLQLDQLDVVQSDTRRSQHGQYADAAARGAERTCEPALLLSGLCGSTRGHEDADWAACLSRRLRGSHGRRQAAADLWRTDIGELFRGAGRQADSG
jgi:putative ABC transport system ATP-binding protein